MRTYYSRYLLKYPGRIRADQVLKDLRGLLWGQVPGLLRRDRGGLPWWPTRSP